MSNRKSTGDLSASDIKWIKDEALARAMGELARTVASEYIARDSFLTEWVAELPEWERPSDAELADLARRLLEADIKDNARRWNDNANERGGVDRWGINATAPRVDVDALAAQNTPHGRLVRREKEREPEPKMPMGFLGPGPARVRYAVLMPGIARAWQAERAPRIAARLALANHREGKDELAGGNRAEPELAAAVARELPAMLATLGDPPAEDAAERVAGFLAKFHGSAEFVAEIRKAPPLPAERWAWSGPVVAANYLAAMLWRIEVRPNLERLGERRDSAGLIAPVLTTLTAVTRAAVSTRNGAQHSLFDPSSAEIRDDAGRVVASLRLPAVDGKTVDLAALRSLAAHRLLRRALWRGYEKRFIEQQTESSVLYVEGGWSKLPEWIGMSPSKKAVEQAKAAALAMDALTVNTPRGEGRIFAVFAHRAAGRQHARLEIQLMGPLRPGYVAEELGEHRIADDKKIVPVPLPQMLPPMVGREREHSAIAHLQWLTLREQRLRAAEFVETGAVAIDERRWHKLADEAMVPRKLLAELLKAWAEGNEGAAAFLTRPETWRFGLADAYELERRSIVSAGRREAGGAKKGRRFSTKKEGRSPGRKK